MEPQWVDVGVRRREEAGGGGRRGVGAVGFRSVVQWMPAHADRAGQTEGSGG